MLLVELATERGAMIERIKEISATIWRGELTQTLWRYLLAGAVTTVVGYVIIAGLVEFTSLEDDFANYIQAVAVFFIFYPTYRNNVFKSRTAHWWASLTRWGMVKLFATFVLTPLVFLLISMTGIPYWGNYLATTAATSAFSFFLGFWSFGKKKVTS